MKVERGLFTYFIHVCCEAKCIWDGAIRVLPTFNNNSPILFYFCFDPIDSNSVFSSFIKRLYVKKCFDTFFQVLQGSLFVFWCWYKRYNCLIIIDISPEVCFKILCDFIKVKYIYHKCYLLVIYSSLVAFRNSNWKIWIVYYSLWQLVISFVR